MAVSNFGVRNECSGVRYELKASQRMGSWHGFEYSVYGVDFSFTINVVCKADGDNVELSYCIVGFKSSNVFSESQVCKIAENFLACIKSELEIKLNIFPAPAPAPAPIPKAKNRLQEIFGNYRIYSVASRDDGYVTLVEGKEENEYAAQYQRVILESTSGGRVSFELMTLFYKYGYEACGPDAFFFHSHQFVHELDDTYMNNVIATTYTNHRLCARMH